MKDYAKVINQSREIHGQNAVKETLTKSAMQKTKEAAPIAQKKSGSGFFSVVALFILVAILFAVYWQYTHHKAMLNPPAASSSRQTQTAQPTGPQFDFYTVLPAGGSPSGTSNASAASAAPASVGTPANGGAASPASSSAASTPSTTTTAPAATGAAAPVQTINTATATTSQYYLNAGQFSNAADAQQLLSQLLLLGVEADTQTSQENGSAVYDVVVGPFDDTAAMGVVKQQLAAHQIQTSVIQQ